jgi:hypothetical protein
VRAELAEALASRTRGQGRLLPRAFRLDVRGDGANVGGFGALGTDVAMTLSGSFSGWGPPVRITPPGSYAPLEELFGQFFTF